MEFGCSKCPACRVNRRRLTMARILLESECHAQNAFATLTYEDAPKNLSPLDLKLFLRRFRRCYPTDVRYFAVGEYGDLFQRPHYHLALFGVSPFDEELVSRVWGKGFVHLGELNAATAAYVAGYVTKKMTVAGADGLEGRVPEFSRMSLKPGLGAWAMPQIASGLMSEGGSMALADLPDVPSEVRVSGKRMPLGRYLKGKLREGVGWDKRCPDLMKDVLKAQAAALSTEELQLRERKREVHYEKAVFRTKVANSKKRL